MQGLSSEPQSCFSSHFETSYTRSAQRNYCFHRHLHHHFILLFLISCQSYWNFLKRVKLNNQTRFTFLTAKTRKKRVSSKVPFLILVYVFTLTFDSLVSPSWWKAELIFFSLDQCCINFFSHRYLGKTFVLKDHFVGQQNQLLGPLTKVVTIAFGFSPLRNTGGKQVIVKRMKMLIMVCIIGHPPFADVYLVLSCTSRLDYSDLF